MIENIWRQGGFLESWSEGFDLKRWERAAEEEGISFPFYANRERSLDEVLPWDHLYMGVNRRHYIHEYEQAHQGLLSPDCRAQSPGWRRRRISERRPLRWINSGSYMSRPAARYGCRISIRCARCSVPSSAPAFPSGTVRASTPTSSSRFFCRSPSGTASLCQIADIRVREDVDIAALPAQLTAVMPEGIRVTDCYENAMKPAELKWMRVNGTWEYDTADTETVAAKCRELFSAPVEVMRKTKRGEGLFTVTEHVRDLTFTAGDGIVTVEGIVSCAEPVVNPELLTAAVPGHTFRTARRTAAASAARRFIAPTERLTDNFQIS